MCRGIGPQQRFLGTELTQRQRFGNHVVKTRIGRLCEFPHMFAKLSRLFASEPIKVRNNTRAARMLVVFLAGFANVI
jgi:hypothetical protein